MMVIGWKKSLNSKNQHAVDQDERPTPSRCRRLRGHLGEVFGLTAGGEARAGLVLRFGQSEHRLSALDAELHAGHNVGADSDRAFAITPLDRRFAEREVQLQQPSRAALARRSADCTGNARMRVEIGAVDRRVASRGSGFAGQQDRNFGKFCSASPLVAMRIGDASKACGGDAETGHVFVDAADDLNFRADAARRWSARPCSVSRLPHRRGETIGGGVHGGGILADELHRDVGAGLRRLGPARTFVR